VGAPEDTADRVAEHFRRAAPGEDVEARRAKAAIAGRLFSGSTAPVTVGRYRVEGRIGAGGMGVVYRAHDPELARDVALKLLNPDAVDDTNAEQARARLLREARTMAKLAHPNVIHVYDVGTVGDGVFIAMELVDGSSLSRWLQTPKPWREILHAFVAAGRGLAAAHAAGIVHRDFKPENVLVGSDGRVRVGDFGLAGAPEAHPTEADWDGETETTLTRTGALLGTPKYMAPEQESGAPADASSDQFSFCVALYEGLCGVPPFAGMNVAEYRRNVRMGILRTTPTRAAELPHALLNAILMGLCVDPGQRHPNMKALLDGLDLLGAPPRRRRGLPWLLAGTASVGAAAAALGWSLGRQPSEHVAEPVQFGPAIVDTSYAAPVQSHGVATIPAATPPAVEPPKPIPHVEAQPDPEVAGRKANKRSRRSGHDCYWTEDTLRHLTHHRSAVHPLLWLSTSERCFDCGREAQRYVIDKLGIPSGVQCEQHWLCRDVDLARCQ